MDLGTGWNVFVLLQDFTPIAESEGVQVPIIPLLVSVIGLSLLAAFAASAFLRPVTEAVVRKRKAKPPPKRAPEPARPPPPPPPPQPVYRRAPIRIEFPQIPTNFPDVWGVGEPLEMEFVIESKSLMERSTVPSLSARIGDETLQLSFQRGKARVKKMFQAKGQHPIQVDLKVKGETLPRRTARTLKAVVYREEMAEVFDNFKTEASRAIAPIRHDATPWEVLDILMEANSRLPEETLRRIVQGFEEAKFSNHPVTRVSYERMIRALLELERVEL